MLGNTMLGKYMCDKKDSQILGGTMNSCQNEYSLFGESVNNKLQLEDVGRVSMKSIDMEFYGHSGIGSCFRRP